MIYKAEPSDLTAIIDLALLLWPGHEPESMTEEFSEFLSRADCAIFLASDNCHPVGFAQCQLRRDYVEGTESSPVGYLEGIFVHEKYRRQGLARKLLKSCEAWAEAMGCTEFASDCELDNDDSLRFHLKAGFIEANRIICFTKRLSN